MKVVFATMLASAAASEWDAFKLQFGKVFNGDEHEAGHKATFLANLVMHAEQNAKGENLKFGINQFTDLTHDQFAASGSFGYIAAPDHPTGDSPILKEHIYQGETLASSIDWQQLGSVTPVKDQGKCGSCWAFSTTGGIEGAWKNTVGYLEDSSEQQIIDCNPQNYGCGGGNVGVAIQYVETAYPGLAQESAYGYQGGDSYPCRVSSAARIGIGQYGITGYVQVGNSASSMKSALNHFPISISVEADQGSFQSYKSGILSSGCGTNLDHAILAVGYGTEGGVSYFRFKNSWNTYWGDSGYIKMNQNGNVCGIYQPTSQGGFRAYPTTKNSIVV